MTQSPCLPELPKPNTTAKELVGIGERDFFIADQMNAHYLKGYEAGSAAAAQAVPEGFVLVPREPTEHWAYRVIRHHQPDLEVGSKAWIEELRMMLWWHDAILNAAPTSWCTHCGCGNDAAGYAHAPLCQRSKRAAPTQGAEGAAPQAVVGEAPTGAIFNGRALAERLEWTGFECEGGDLRLCSDWVEFRRCFEHLAEFAAALTPSPTPTAPQEADVLREALSQAERDLLTERRRQVEAEGYSADHDAAHGTSELSLAAAAYALSSVYGFTAKSLSPWPWETQAFKPKHPYRDLERAGALVLAAMECWQRRLSKNLASDQEFIESRPAARAALAQHQPQQGEAA